jgi:hypothetical protein
MFYVYLLHSAKDNGFYIGYSAGRLRRSPDAGVATADFPLVAVGILEKHGVIARRVVVAILRAFDILRAGLADDRAEPVDFFFRVRPKGEAVGVAAVARFFIETDEGCRLVVTLGGIADLRFRGADVREPERREEYVIKFPGFRKVGHPKVNVIETVDTHGSKMMFATNTRPATLEPNLHAVWAKLKRRLVKS